jgi:hypothetical protein
MQCRKSWCRRGPRPYLHGVELLLEHEAAGFGGNDRRSASKPALAVVGVGFVLNAAPVDALQRELVGGRS